MLPIYFKNTLEQLDKVSLFRVQGITKEEDSGTVNQIGDFDLEKLTYTFKYLTT